MSSSIDCKVKVLADGVLHKLFNPKSEHLTLSRLHDNDELFASDTTVELNRPDDRRAVFEAIAESALHLRALNLSDNKINDTDHFEMLNNIAPELESLNLSNNNIPNLRDLARMQDAPNLKVLILAGNPLWAQYESWDQYEREAREMFTSLQVLDGRSLSRELPAGWPSPKSLYEQMQARQRQYASAG